MTLTNEIEVLLIDDDQDVIDAYTHLLEISGYTTYAVTDPYIGVNLLHKNWPGVVVTDMYMPGLSGMEVLEQVKEVDSELPVIIITGHGDIPMAVESVQKGATDFLQKPLQPPELLELLKEHLTRRQYRIEQRQQLTQSASKLLLGESPLMLKLRQQIAEVSMTNRDVLIEGENGTGRHTVARMLHHNSENNNAPFVVIKGDTILSKEDLQRKMLSARSGTLCIHNPQHIFISAQQWLCRFLLEQERLQKKEVRVFVIIDGSPEKAVEEERLLPELFYFLSQVKVQLAPLKQRTSDIAPLFSHFLKQSCHKLNKPVPSIDKAYINTLNRHEWPGNVLELKNVAELYAIGIVKLAGQERTKPLEQMSSPLDDLVDDYEKQIIEDALYLFAGRINEVSNYLQIPRKKLYLRMKKHSLDKAQYKVPAS